MRERGELKKGKFIILLRVILVENAVIDAQKMYTGEILANHKGGKIKPFGYGK